MASQSAVPPSGWSCSRAAATAARSRVTGRISFGLESKSISIARSRSVRPVSSRVATALRTSGSLRNMLAEESMASARVSGSSPAFSKAAISCGWPSWRTRKASFGSPGTGLPPASVTTTASWIRRTSIRAPRSEALRGMASSAVEPSSSRAATRR